jgi:hypothetical protein
MILPPGLSVGLTNEKVVTFRINDIMGMVSVECAPRSCLITEIYGARQGTVVTIECGYDSILESEPFDQYLGNCIACDFVHSFEYSQVERTRDTVNIKITII